MSNKYFYVHNGLTVGALSVDAASGNLQTSGVFTTTNSTAATTSTLGTNAGALQVAGGAGIQGTLYVGGLIYSGGNQVLTNQGGAFVSSLSAGTDTFVNSTTGNITIWSTATFASVTSRGTSGIAAGTTPNAITITNNAQALSTSSGNALNVAGGIGANAGYFGTIQTTGAGTFGGNVTFGGAVTFNGTATYVYSTQTAYTDNILEIHVPPGGVNSQWQSNDGKDIGLRFHYYTNSTDTNAALVLAQDSGALEWYSSGAESTTSVFTSATYGIFKTGGITLTNTTATTGVGTGALQVAGGVYIAGGLYVGGVLTATSFVGTFQGNSTTANNLNNGKNGEMPIQNGPASTTFIPAGTAGYLLQYQTANTATWVTTGTMIVGNANAVLNTPTSSAGTYYLHFVGANTASYQTPGTVSSVSVDPSTGYLSATRFVGSGAGLTNSTVPNSALVNSTITVSPGTGVAIGGSPVALGGTVTITNTGVTTFSGGTTGLTPNSATTGTVTLGGTLALASGGTSATLVASPGSVVYGTASAMAFNTAGTAGQLLVSGGTSAPTFTSTSSIRVGYADTSTYSTNLLGGALGSIPYQTAAGATAFLPIGSTNYVLSVGAGSTATWTALGSLTGGLSNTATNIAGGTTGQIPIQGSSGATAFISTGSVGNLLQMTSVTTASFISTLTLQVGFATTATNVNGGSVNATTGVFSGVTTVTNTTGVSSTITGAFQVAGGVGIGGGMYVGGISTFTNNVVTSNVPIVYDQTGISVGNSAGTIDTFNATIYRSAKYVITVSNAGNTAYQSTEILVIHDGTTAYLQDVSVFTGAAPIMTFAVTGGGTVTLTGTGTLTGNTVKVQRIYTTV
jgi:hypothetical protein